MYFLIYRSEVAVPMTDETLKVILTKARNRNQSLNITGMLLHFDNKFLQLLEGDEEQVKKLYADICNDVRHKNVVLLKDGEATERLFPEWTMSFRIISDQELINEPAYKDIYKPGSPGAHDLVSLFNLLRGKTDPALRGA